MKILYIANARLPTEKAHGYQIFQMCQGFIDNKVDVTLFRPLIKNTPELVNVDISVYYNLREKISIKTIWTLDLLQTITVRYPLFKFFGTFVVIGRTFLYALNLGLYLSFYKRIYKNATIYMRDINLFSWMSPFLPKNMRKNCIIEVHSLSSSPVRKRRQAKILKKAKMIVTVTSYMKKELINLGVSENKIIAEPDAVDLDSFLIKESKKEAREKLGLPTDIKIASFVGKYHTNGNEKGILEIIIASKYVFKKYPPIKFYFIGGPLDRVGKYRKIIEKEKLPISQFIFIEKQPVENIPYYLKSSDILLMPHPYSEFYAYYVSPLKLFEYMSAKKPIIASSLPAIEEILTDGKNAYLGKPSDSKSIAKNICKIFDEPELAKKISEQAYKDVQYYTWRKRANRIIERIRKHDR